MRRAGEARRLLLDVVLDGRSCGSGAADTVSVGAAAGWSSGTASTGEGERAAAWRLPCATSTNCCFAYRENIAKRPKRTSSSMSLPARMPMEELPPADIASCRVLADEPVRLHTSDQSELNVRAIPAYVEKGTNSAGKRLSP